MDEMDKKIIALLKENSRMPNAQISNTVHLSLPAVGERIRKLKEAGYIRRFTVVLDRVKMGKCLLAHLFVTLDGPTVRDAFLDCIRESASIIECHHITGEYDYLLKVAVSGTKDLEALISETIKSVPGVARTNTVIVLSTVKEEV